MVQFKLLGIALLAASAHCQSILRFQQTFKDPHYSQIDSSLWPINVAQYSSDMVIRADISDRVFREYMLANRHKSEDHAEDDLLYNVWAMSKTKNHVDLQIDGNNLQKLLQQFPKLKYEIIIDDLAQTIYESYPKDYYSEVSAKEDYIKKITKEVVESTEMNIFSEMFFQDYRPLETIDAWLELLQQTYPDMVKIEVIGETYEHRSYKVVHVSANRSNDDHSKKKTIVVTGGVHAREWISVSSVCYSIYGLLKFYQENPDRKDVLDQLDFLFIPVLNPDGYVYTWETDRLWRKNRQETSLPRCFGIDIDHSYDYHWTKSSDWACGEEYSGEVPFEAIESRIWNDYLNATNNDHKIHGYIDLHSYSQEVLYPYAYSCSEQPRDEENLIELAYGISKAIRMQSGKYYEVLPACVDKDSDFLPDLGSGSALDFMYHNKAYWAFQLKLRDSGSHGFLLPGKFVEPVGKEVLAGIRYFCKFILEEY